MDETVTTTAESSRTGHTLNTFVYSRRFAWLDLACALAAAALWYVSGGRLGPWPLLVALPPWVIRLASGNLPFRQTRFDPLLWIFLISAAIGAWASYNQPAAWHKFWLLAGALILYYALAAQRSPNLWRIITGLAVFGGAVAVYFLATHNWSAIPAKIETINQIGLRWMQLRPDALGELHTLHPNVSGGLIAMLIPFSLAAAARAIRRRRALTLVVAVVTGILMGLGLAFTTSRGGWLALVGGLGIWALWAGSGRVAEILFLSRRKAFGLQLLLLLGLGLSLMLLSNGGLTGLLERLPGPANAGSRLEIGRDAVDVAGDFWITGGGLAAFDGLYSQYIRVIPHHALIHSHNLFLNVTVEQGVVGLLSLIATLILAFWWLVDPEQSRYRRSAHGFSLASGATLSALVVICLHGLVDDPLYGSRGVLLLWLPLGLVSFLYPLREGWMNTLRSIDQPALIAIGIITFLTAALLVAFREPVLASWQSNLGALDMARVELRDYPTGEWSDGREVADLASARTRFERSLLFNANNRTALHRLGLIAMLERDYESAKDSLYSAYLLDRDHKGIRKSLMYAYVWTGDTRQAMPLLRDFPEARAELSTYQWWWNEMGYPNLSQAAEEAGIQLDNLPSQP